MRKILFTLSLLISCSCNAHNDFETFVGQLKAFKPPISFRTIEFNPNHLARKYDLRLFEKFKSRDANDVLGVVFNEDKFVGIIYIVPGDVPTPILVTYDKLGSKIDSLNLFENASGYNEKAETFEFVTISTNRQILSIDTTKTWSIDSTKNTRTLSNASIKIDTIKHVITSVGKIEIGI